MIQDRHRKEIAQRALELHEKGLDNKTIGLRLGISTGGARIRIKYWKAIRAGYSPADAEKIAAGKLKEIEDVK